MNTRCFPKFYESKACFYRFAYTVGTVCNLPGVALRRVVWLFIALLFATKMKACPFEIHLQTVDMAIVSICESFPRTGRLSISASDKISIHMYKRKTFTAKYLKRIFLCF